MSEKTRLILENILYTWWISWFWGMSYYLYQVSKWDEFRWHLFFLNMILAFFVWFVIWDFLPDTNYTNWLLAISWFSSYWILQFIEKQWALFVLKRTLWINDEKKWKQ
jgi:hypothetical protein